MFALILENFDEHFELNTSLPLTTSRYIIRLSAHRFADAIQTSGLSRRLVSSKSSAEDETKWVRDVTGSLDTTRRRLPRDDS